MVGQHSGGGSGDPPMTDTYDYGETPAAPPIEEWRNEAPPAFQEIADESAAVLQSYQQHRDLADQARAAGEAVVSGVGQISQNFSAMVASDPASYDVARTLARNAIGVLVGAVPGAEPEQMVEHVGSIYGDVERQLARTAVSSLAGRDEIAARAMLDRVGETLPEAERAEFGGYIDVMAKARSIDGAAARIMGAQEAARMEDATAFGYLSALTNKSGDVAFRPGWAQAVIADKRLPPDATAALVDTQARLISNGDEPVSDPFLLRRVLDGTASGQWNLADVMQYAGAGLKLSDALGAAQYTMGGKLNPDQLAELNSLRGTLASAQNILAKPEYGQAGTEAFGRFVDWLMPKFREQPGTLNPRSDEWLFKDAGGQLVFNQFKPRFDDIVLGQTRMPWDYLNTNEGSTDQRLDRPDLAEIFGRGDPAKRAARVPPVTMPNAGVEEDGRPPVKSPIGDQIIPPSQE